MGIEEFNPISQPKVIRSKEGLKGRDVLVLKAEDNTIEKDKDGVEVGE